MATIYRAYRCLLDSDNGFTEISPTKFGVAGERRQIIALDLRGQPVRVLGDQARSSYFECVQSVGVDDPPFLVQAKASRGVALAGAIVYVEASGGSFYFGADSSSPSSSGAKAIILGCNRRWDRELEEYRGRRFLFLVPDGAELLLERWRGSSCVEEHCLALTNGTFEARVNKEPGW